MSAAGSLFEDSSVKPTISVKTIAASLRFIFELTENLRSNYIHTDISFSGNIKKKLSYANKIESKFAVLIGEEESNQGVALVKNLDTGKQIKIKFNELSKYLKKILQLK